jgi:hypothetical protein
MEVHLLSLTSPPYFFLSEYFPKKYIGVGEGQTIGFRVDKVYETQNLAESDQ